MMEVMVVVLVINVIVTENMFGNDDSGDHGCTIDEYDSYSKYMW